MTDFIHTIDGKMILYTQKEMRLHITGPSEVCTRYSSDYDHHDSHHDNHHCHFSHDHHHLGLTEINDDYYMVQSLISIDYVIHKIATNHATIINPSLIPVINNNHNHHHQLQSSLLYKNYEHFYHHGYFILSSIIDNDLIDKARQYINNQYISWLNQSKRQDDWRCHLMLDLTNIKNNYHVDRDEVDGGEVVDDDDDDDDNVQAIEHPAVIRLLLQSPMLLKRVELLIGCKISGIFYTQIAFRTPIVSSSSSSSSSGSSSRSSSRSSMNMNRYSIVEDKVTTSNDSSHNHKSSAISTATTTTTTASNNNTINNNTSMKNPDYHPGAEYHLDGNANAFGIRFPDPWTVLVGIALVDITTVDMGNFTVFPGECII
jgi:hypothetical protein